MNIKVSFSGQYLGQSGHITSFQDDTSNWVKRLFNPREYGRDIFKNKDVKECYAIWYDNENGYNYSMIMRSPDTNTRDGYIMIVLCTGNRIFSNGNDVQSLFLYLKELFLDSEYSSVQNMNEICSDKVKDVSKTIRLSNEMMASTASEKKGKAFRQYQNTEDLLMILQHPNQQEYLYYDRVFILPASDYSELVKSGYTELTSPIRVVYIIKMPIPPGTFVSSHRLYHGDVLNVTYSKKGCSDQQFSIRLTGSPSQYIKYDNNEVEILSAQEAGIKFEKSIVIDCKSDRGQKITCVRARINDVTYTCDKNNKITFKDDLEKYELTIGYPGYEEEPIILGLSDFEKGVKDVVLRPQTKTIKVKIDTGNENICGEVSIKTNDPLYPFLNDAAKKRMAINKFKFGESPFGEEPNEGTENGGGGSRWWKRLAFGSFMIILVFSLIYLVWSFFPIDSKKNGNPLTYSCNCKTCTCDDCVSGDEYGNCNCNCDGCKPKEDLSVDVSYLKRADSWSKDSLQSDYYKQLLDHLKNGQIDDIVSKEWFTKDDEINGFWHNDRNDGIFDLLKTINESPQKEKDDAIQLLRESFSNNELQLSFLNGRLKKLISKSSESASSDITGAGRSYDPTSNVSTTKSTTTASSGDTPGRKVSHP